MRVFEQWHQKSNNLLKANEYRKIAFEYIESQLKTELPEYTKLEYLYLAANYARLFGNPEKSQNYLLLLNSAIENVKDKENSDFAEYLKELSIETPNIRPGGKIDPQAIAQ